MSSRIGITFPTLPYTTRPSFGITYPRPLISNRVEVLRTHILNSILALISGKTPSSTTMKLLNGSGTDINPDVITARLNMTGRWMDINASGAYQDQGNCVLISPQHTLTAAHAYGNGTPGDTTAFRGTDGSIHIRVTKSVIQLAGGPSYGSDTKLCLLDNYLNGVYVGPLPSSVTPFKILPANYAQYLVNINTGNQLPMIINSGHNLQLGGEETIILSGSYNLNTNIAGTGGFMYNYPCYLPSPIAEWSKGSTGYAIPGDSCHPSWVLINGELILMGMQLYTVGTLQYGNRVDEIQTVMNTLSDAAGAGYSRQTIGTADLSRFYHI